MLVIIDMQNQVLDPMSDFYVPGSEELVDRIAQRLAKARENNELVLLTRDIPIEKKDVEEESPALQLIPKLTPLPNERVIKKYYFTLPPEKLIELKKQLFDRKDEQKSIEVVSIEANLCVLSNMIALQSAFPEADFFLDPALLSENQHGKMAIELLKDFNVSIL
ncbi:cysteine hydrolase [Enterococcus durans]|uniref:isochorismatase family protein n=1 Tax=Enterococcus durans TaxID=53345 RepID=UPI000F50C8B5|nr:isochorismatase family protein [Enterococcus durans]ROX82800.1 cysteine hydrolase [Enterococcus durans]